MQAILENPLYNHIFIALILILGLAIMGRILKSLAEIIFKRFVSKTQTTYDDRILRVVGSYLVPTSITIGFALGIREVRKAFPADQVTQHQILDYASEAVFVLFVILVARILSRILKATLEWYIEDLASKTNRTGTSQVAFLLMKFVNILLFFIASLIVLDHVGMNVGSLLVSLGVGSLAVALAAQETISNMIGWFVILLDQPFRVGDQIRLASGDEGKVYQIGLRATRILNADNNIVVIPNGDLVKNRIVNISLPDMTTRVVIDFNVPFDSDIDVIRQTLLEVAKNDKDVIQEPAPEVLTANFGDSGILLRLVARVYFSQRAVIESRLREAISRNKALRLSVQQHVVQVVNGPQTPQTH
ncbi:MAG TPA: mechanosensitive ion channel family protein [Bacteroidota bacterium]|nr:mechanosensitive ion channel family protein [Bacteroidota bacterium]